MRSNATNTMGLQTAASRQLPITQFIWGAGVECSFVPHLNVDQFEWTQHNRFWKDDFRRAREELGVSHLRYSFPWHLIETKRGHFDWSMADERMEFCEQIGIKLLLDVMHFGTPLWLKQAVGDVEFPEALEDFTRAIVGRYAQSIEIISPCNEPLVVALFSGDFGFWPPHSRKWRGYMPILSRIVQGVNRSIRAVRETKHDAVVLLCDSAENYKTRQESLAVEVRRRNLRRFLALDLLTGRVDHHHPLYQWLVSYGFNEIDLDWLRNNPQSPDVLGLDYYTHSDWQLDVINGNVRQRRAESPVGLYGVGNAYYQRYGLPLMLTETSVEGQGINREIWLETTIDDGRRLREEGVPLLGYFWWPLVDQLDWDGALTHRVGKIHEVGLYNLRRQGDGTLARVASPLVKLFREAATSGEQRVGKLEFVAEPVASEEDQYPPLSVTASPQKTSTASRLVELPQEKSADGNGASRLSELADEPAPGIAAEPTAASRLTTGASDAGVEIKSTDRYGIVVFSHLRWGFVWQRPQQFLSRFARKHNILFFEEPFFDLRESDQPYLAMHRVMPNVTVATPHCAPSLNKNPQLPGFLRKFVREAMQDLNDNGEFDAPLLWYYSPMDSAWSLGQFRNRGIVYDSMDELSQFSGAPAALIDNEARLLSVADIVFAGGYELTQKKKQKHQNVHFFGCGVEYEHFARANDPDTVVPPDIDFIARPILGWFGVVDERVDYGLVGEVARERTDWSIAMVGPVVKVDPSLLPHSPNLFWLGQRDYQVLPNYCKAFDVCIMPFAMNAATEFINPTKALEYMATGRPIVSTPVRDVVRQWSDLIYIAKNNKDDFVQKVGQAIDERNEQRIKRGIDLAQQAGWDNTVRTMQKLIAEAIGQSNRRSAAVRIEPLPDTEIAYQYAATPGS